MSALLVSMLLGGGLGALQGRSGQCSAGTCPLIANRKRGTVYGAALGLMFHFAFANSHPPSTNVHAIA